jgi:hypothetical protein
MHRQCLIDPALANEPTVLVGLLEQVHNTEVAIVRYPKSWPHDVLQVARSASFRERQQLELLLSQFRFSSALGVSEYDSTITWRENVRRLALDESEFEVIKVSEHMEHARGPSRGEIAPKAFTVDVNCQDELEQMLDAFELWDGLGDLAHFLMGRYEMQRDQVMLVSSPMVSMQPEEDDSTTLVLAWWVSGDYKVNREIYQECVRYLIRERIEPTGIAITLFPIMVD